MPAPIEAPEKEKKMIDKVETILSPKEQSTRKLILSPYEIPVSYQKKVNESQMKGLDNSNLIISEQNDEEEWSWNLLFILLYGYLLYFYINILH